MFRMSACGPKWTFGAYVLEFAFWGQSGHRKLKPPCPFLTHQRHWLRIAAMVLKPVSAPIKALVGADTMLSHRLGSGRAATRVH